MNGQNTTSEPITSHAIVFRPALPCIICGRPATAGIVKHKPDSHNNITLVVSPVCRRCTGRLAILYFPAQATRTRP